MTKIRAFRSTMMLCGSVLLLSGCHQQQTGANGVPFPAPHAAPSVQAQIQAIESDPHIPTAQKADIEARIAHGNGVRTEKTPSNAP